ncbi:hypothetical protein [Pseudoxanthomonas mexicana]|uniref:hypothetical protein n=1 Tax=Pseudoxanthomonas mexicana TaxID=128785 RepID=UPI00398AAC81
MLLGLEIEIWWLLVLLIVAPTVIIAVLNLIFRKRGGIGVGWGGVLFVVAATVVGWLLIFDKVRF